MHYLARQNATFSNVFFSVLLFTPSFIFLTDVIFPVILY